jgi:hypothetical protein
MGLRAEFEHLWTAMITRIKSHEIVQEPTLLSWKRPAVWMFNVNFCMEQLHKTIDDGSLIKMLAGSATDAKPVHRLQQLSHNAHLPVSANTRGIQAKAR